jgi:chromosome segregation ATPase
MKDNGLLVLAISACMVSAALLCWRSGRLRETAQAGIEPGPVAGRDARISELERRIESIGPEVAAQSNRADAAVSKCADEKNMDEQLRKQIEKMIGEEIALKAETERKKQESNVAAEKARVEIEALKNRLLDIKREKKGGGGDLESLRKDMEQTEPAEADRPSGK